MNELKLVRVTSSHGTVSKGEIINVSDEQYGMYFGILYACGTHWNTSANMADCEVITDETEIESLIAKYNIITESSVYLPITEDYPKVGVEGIGYSKDWIDEDSCPNGTRVCFRDYNDVSDNLGWFTSTWDLNNNAYTCQSHWHLNLNSPPTHFMVLPSTKYLK